MPATGYIYILMNASMPKLLKIGKTTKPPEERAIELSVSTGVPTPYHVAYQVRVDDCDWAEREIHNKLEEHRVTSNREFFSAPLKQAILVLSEYDCGSQDFPVANLELLRREALEGNKESAMKLGQMYEKGLGVKTDLFEAYFWYLVAQIHQAKDAVAKTEELGKDLKYGERILAQNLVIPEINALHEVPFPLPEGLLSIKQLVPGKSLDEKARSVIANARRGDSTAQAELGRYFEEGWIVKQDYHAALEWYLRAAKAGNESTHLKIAEMFENGVGTPTDPEKAYAFYQLAATKGSSEALKALARVVLSAEQLEGAKKFAQEFAQLI